MNKGTMNWFKSIVYFPLLETLLAIHQAACWFLSNKIQLFRAQEVFPKRFLLIYSRQLFDIQNILCRRKKSETTLWIWWRGERVKQRKWNRKIFSDWYREANRKLKKFSGFLVGYVSWHNNPCRLINNKSCL